MIGVANDVVKILNQVFRMRRKSAKSLSAALSVGETLEIGKVAFNFLASWSYGCYDPFIRNMWTRFTPKRCKNASTYCFKTPKKNSTH